MVGEIILKIHNNQYNQTLLCFVQNVKISDYSPWNCLLFSCRELISGVKFVVEPFHGRNVTFINSCVDQAQQFS